MNKKSEKEPNLLRNSSREQKQELLGDEIERNEQDLLAGIRVYIRKFQLVESNESFESLAREIRQDTVVTALDKAENYDPSRPARPWLLGIAINHIHHRLRNKHIITALADTPQSRRVTQEFEDGAPSEEEILDLLYQSKSRPVRHDQLTLNEFLSLVNDSDREVLRLAFVENLRGKALATELGIREGAAWARLSRAIKSLRETYFRSEQAKGR